MKELLDSFRVKNLQRQQQREVRWEQTKTGSFQLGAYTVARRGGEIVVQTSKAEEGATLFLNPSTCSVLIVGKELSKPAKELVTFALGMCVNLGKIPPVSLQEMYLHDDVRVPLSVFFFIEGDEFIISAELFEILCCLYAQEYLRYWIEPS